MSSRAVFRHILAVVTLAVSVGCAGGDPLQELRPEPAPRTGQVEADRLASIQQEISSLGYSTYLGFSGVENGQAIAVDGTGNAYVCGEITSFGSNYNIFVAKMSPSGSNLYYIYYPGGGTGCRDIAVDASGNAYVVGPGSAGPSITKLNPTGTAVVYSATLGWESITGVRVDASGNAYVVGSVAMGSADTDVVVGKINPTGTAFVYSVAFGGTSYDNASDIAIDGAGNAYIVGATYSTDFPVWNAFQPTLKGDIDAFVAKLNATGTALTYSTYLGGTGGDGGEAIAVDSWGNVYVSGTTDTSSFQDFPVTTGAVQTTPGGYNDAFVAKFSSAGNRLYSTYIGGSGNDVGGGIAVSSAGVAYVTGSTGSTNFPTSSLAFQPFSQGGSDAFVVQLSPTFNAYTYSTYLGGGGNDFGDDIALDTSSNVYLTGGTYSTNFPTTVYGPGGAFDAYVTKLNGP